MKNLISFALNTATLCAALSASAWAEEMEPGQVDFGAFAAPKDGGEFVEVNVPASLIAFATTIIEKEEPDVAKLLRGLKSVRVNVIGMNEDNRSDIRKRAQKVRQELTGKGWERIVMAQEKQQEVGVYLKMTPKGAVQGLVAVVVDGNEHAVFVNVVGEINPEQIALLGQKLHLDPLEKLGQAVEKHGGNAKSKSPEAPEKDAEKAKDN